MALTHASLRNAKPRSSPYKLADGGGLYLLIKPNGARYWRLKYRFAGKEKVLALGVYDEVPLAEARDARDDAKRLLRERKDPGVVRKSEKLRQRHAAANSFQAVAEEWIEKKRNAWDPGHADQVAASLTNNAYSEIGHRPLAEIEAPELLAMLRKIESRGAHEIRQRVQQRTGAVFRYGIATGRCARDPSFELRGAFTAPSVRNHAALVAKDLPDFLDKLTAYDGEPVTKLAMRLLALTFVRTGELRGADWSEFDLAGAVWRIPGERMKMREPHIVPLSQQAIAVLTELQQYSGTEGYAFPHRSNPTKPMSENTILYALYRMGYHSRATGHGFRATASTILNELGYAPDVIERQLAHVERNKVRKAYNRAQYLPERTKMMQGWADLLDGFSTANKKKVVAGRFGKVA